MNPEQYAAYQAYLANQAYRYAADTAQQSKTAALSTFAWLYLLRQLFPALTRYRETSAVHGRMLFDTQRAKNFPGLPRNPRPLEATTLDKFVKNMEPVRAKLSMPQATDHAVSQFALQFVREVENAGRQQIIHGVENDPGLDDLGVVSEPPRDSEPEDGPVRAWARVATGRETCAWCLMLVSRGPVYKTAKAAGEGQQWHKGCDCIVVPVYNQFNWPGKAAADNARKAWIDASKTVARSKENPRHPSGENKGQRMTKNQQTLNELRRRLTSGELSAQEYAGIAA